MSLTAKLTGKTRFRSFPRWRKEPLLVLQVEEHITGYTLDYPSGTTDVDYLRYRDATFSDFQLIPSQ